MDKIEAVMRRFPQNAYDPEDTKSVLYKFIKAIVDEFNITMNNITKVNNMLGIGTVSSDDLYNRFGVLLNISKNKGETDEQYRNRLKVSVTSLSGGTKSAIKYAIASGLGINNDNEAMNRIKVYDAWEYDGDASVSKDYGYVVCSIDLNMGSYSADMADIVAKSANSVKAAGVIIQFTYYNYRMVYYSELDDLLYMNLDSITYDKVGE